MSYRILLEQHAERELRDLPPAALKRIDAKLQALAASPRPQGALKLKSKESEGWRVRAGDYRILYTVDDEAKLVRVYRVKHRRDVYR